jgi:16S rRNA (cytosine967-C5)-methyltransferase
MHPRALLDLASELLRSVLLFDAPTDTLMAAFFRHHRDIGSRERHTLGDTVYAVLRERLKWQHLARSGFGALERRLAALAWSGNTAFLEAALAPDEREWLAKARVVALQPLGDAQRHNLPEWLATLLQARVGEEFWPLAQSLLLSGPLDVRVNIAKAKREVVQQALIDQGWDCAPTPWSPWGLRLVGKPQVNRSQQFERGEIEVQDEGSQLLALLTEARRGEMVADFCAGAGGKTLALGAMMRNTGRLYAFDTSAHRLAALRPRLARSGLSNVYPIAIAHERDERIKRLAGKMDRVLVDAPCSGLGTLRRNPDLKWRQNPQQVAHQAEQQAAILKSAARMVKPGGRLVYATCSLLDAENEAIADVFSAAHSEFAPLDVGEVLGAQRIADAAALVQDGRLRLWPHRHSTDGFFAAVWQRS